MPGFDVKAYEDEVLKPLRSRVQNLPNDLRARYAVEPGMDAAALRERVEAVVSVWNKHAMRSGPMGQLCKVLQKQHKELPGDPRTPQFWTEWAAERQRRVGPQIDQVVKRLVDAYGPLGVITAEQLAATAAAQTGLGDAELTQAAAKAGVRVVPPERLPTAPGMRGSFAGLATSLTTAGAPSVPALLHPGITAYGLLGGFTAPGAARPVALDEAAARARNEQLEKLPDDPTVRAQKEAVGLLASEARGGTDLAALALYHLLTEVRALRAGPVVLHDLLTGRGLVPAEAALVAVTVFAEGGAPVRDPTAAVNDLLAEGRVLAARQAANALAGPDGDAARAAVARQHHRVEDLREQAKRELAAGREQDAGDRLREALRLGADVPGLTELLAAVPAAPVLGVSAHPEGAGVRVAWRPAAGHGDDTEFRVVRAVDRDPAEEDDGIAIAPTGLAAVDAGPPVARDLHYAVFARAPGGRWSRPACAGARVVPPVGEVEVDGTPDAVTGRWTTHPDVASVEVTRSEGDPDAPGVAVPVDRDRGFRDTTARAGVTYFYRIVACYPAVHGGGVLRAAPQMHRGARRLAAVLVRSLHAALTAGDGPTVRLTWGQRPGNEVVVRRAGTRCPWEYGARVPRAELDRWGTALRGAPVLRDGSATLEATVPPGRSYLTAFTLDGASALRGGDAVVDLLDPVRRVTARRFGDDVLVTWQWPDAVTAADVGWETGARRITRQRYRDEGGFRLAGARAVRRVDVEALVLEGDGDVLRAPAVRVEVGERPPELTYAVARRGLRWAGGVRATVTVSGAESATEATLVLVGAAGHAMPLTLRAEDEIDRWPITVTPEAPVVLPEVTVPGHLRKPYWLRCFLVDPAPASALLVDPPVSQLKVS